MTRHAYMFGGKYLVPGNGRDLAGSAELSEAEHVGCSQIVRGEENNMKAIKSVEPVVDYLAEELKREEKRQAKHARMALLVKDLKAKGAAVGR